MGHRSRRSASLSAVVLCAALCTADHRGHCQARPGVPPGGGGPVSGLWTYHLDPGSARSGTTTGATPAANVHEGVAFTPLGFLVYREAEGRWTEDDCLTCCGGDPSQP